MHALTITAHPLLRLGAFTSLLPRPLGEMDSPAWLTELLAVNAAAPVAADERVRAAVRDLLRHGGFKPSGRSKPSSEYLARAAGGGSLKSINAVVDACNAVSLQSGLPISVIDVAQARPPLSVAIAQKGTHYVFNRSGQEIDVSGLLCLFDGDGPCANAVKDAQRTKTGERTTETLSLVWGACEIAEETDRAVQWYRELVERLGAATHVVACT